MEPSCNHAQDGIYRKGEFVEVFYGRVWFQPCTSRFRWSCVRAASLSDLTKKKKREEKTDGLNDDYRNRTGNEQNSRSTFRVRAKCTSQVGPRDVGPKRQQKKRGVNSIRAESLGSSSLSAGCVNAIIHHQVSFAVNLTLLIDAVVASSEEPFGTSAVNNSLFAPGLISSLLQAFTRQTSYASSLAINHLGL